MLLEKGTGYGPQGFTWQDVRRLQEQFVTGFPQGSGMAYSAQHLLREMDRIEKDEIIFSQSSAFCYLAAICWIQFSNTETTLYYAGNQRSPYLQAVNDGYHLAYKCLSSPLDPMLTLQQLSLTLWHEYNKLGNSKYTKDIYQYIGKSIASQQITDIKKMQTELLWYIERIRGSSLGIQARKEIVESCCFILHNYH